MITARFNEFRPLTARFASRGTCGHDIARGDPIGYAPRYRYRKAQTCCTDCWQAWSAENAEAEILEASSGWVSGASSNGNW